jgi:hypothetical protein
MGITAFKGTIRKFLKVLAVLRLELRHALRNFRQAAVGTARTTQQDKAL